MFDDAEVEVALFLTAEGYADVNLSDSCSNKSFSVFSSIESLCYNSNAIGSLFVSAKSHDSSITLSSSSEIES